MFNPARYRRLYRRFLGPLSQTVTITLAAGGSYNVPAHVSRYQERDLVEGGPIQLGDLRLIIRADQLPDALAAAQLSYGDAVTIDGREYGFIHWDSYSRTVGPEIIAYEATVRG